MKDSIILFLSGGLIIVAYVLRFFFDKIKIPNALLLLLGGLIFGPIMGWVGPEDFGSFGSVFSKIVLLFILFESGTRLDVQSIKKSFFVASAFTVVNFLLCAIILGFGLYLYVEIDLRLALFFGVIGAGTSSSIVIPMARQLKFGQSAMDVVIIESTLSDVLALVFGLAIFESLQTSTLDFNQLGRTLVGAVGLSSVVGLVLGYLWACIHNIWTSLSLYGFLSFAMVMMLSGVLELLGLNAGIGVLLFGVGFGNGHLFVIKRSKFFAPKRIRSFESNFFQEASFILQTAFFVFIGIHMQLTKSSVIIFAVGVTVLLTVLRPIVAKVFLSKRCNKRELGKVSWLFPKGLVPAILASLPLEQNVLGGEMVRNFSYTIVLITIVFSSVLVTILGTRHDEYQMT